MIILPESFHYVNPLLQNNIKTIIKVIFILFPIDLSQIKAVVTEDVVIPKPSK